MATDLDKTSILQALADSTGLIVDRTTNPEKVVGQCWLISKGRVLTLASSVANYADAVWALQINFPHPNLSFGVRTITLHPDFNKREARDYYLAQARGPVAPPMMENDIATVALETDLQPPAAERLAELNRALSVPFELTGQDMSGTTRPGDVPQILQSVFSTGRSGLLTFIDQRNIPFARIQIRQTRITRANFQNLYNESAICELIWRQPPGSFAFQPTEYRWPPDVPEIATPTEQLMMEAQRRFDELPQIFEHLGGFDARFSKALPLADFSQIPPHERWLAERIWESIDGYITLNKLPERVCSDTYSVVKMVWDLASMGLLTLNQNVIFHGSGQLGPLLVPAQELDLDCWDSLTSFYIDPISCAPTMAQGNFFGGAHALTNKTLLHTTPIPPTSMGAIVLKDGKLVGLHTGPYPLRGVNNPPPIALQRMMWVGALNDMGTKRLRTTELAAAEAAETAEAKEEMVQRTSMRIRALTEPSMTETAAPIPQETGPLAKFSKVQILGAGAGMAALGLVMMVGSMMAPHGNQQAAPPVVATAPKPDPKPAPTPAATVAQKPSGPVDSDGLPIVSDIAPGGYHKTPEEIAAEKADIEAWRTARKVLGIKDPPSGYVFKDSSKLTEPKRSFKLVSEAKNVDITFVEWPNQSVLLDPMHLLVQRIPIFNMNNANDDHKVEFQGDMPHFHWFGSHYNLPDDWKARITVVSGAFDAPENKAVIFIAKPFGKDNLPDMEYPATVVENLLRDSSIYNPKEATTATDKKPDGSPTTATQAPSGPMGTPEEFNAYRSKIQSLVKAQYKPPAYDLDTNTKVAMSVTVDAEGKIKDIAFVKANPSEDFNGALQKAIHKSQPWPVPPRTKSGTYGLFIRTHANNVYVEEQ